MKTSRLVSSLMAFVFAFAVAFATEHAAPDDQLASATMGYKEGECSSQPQQVDFGWSCSSSATNEICTIDGVNAYESKASCEQEDEFSLLRRL